MPSTHAELFPSGHGVRKREVSKRRLMVNETLRDVPFFEHVLRKTALDKQVVNHPNTLLLMLFPSIFALHIV